MLSMAVAVLALLACLFGIRRTSYAEGFDDGVQQGSLILLREVCLGHVRVEGDRLVFGDGAAFAFYDGDGRQIREIDMGDLDFCEE